MDCTMECTVFPSHEIMQSSTSSDSSLENMSSDRTPSPLGNQAEGECKTISDVGSKIRNTPVAASMPKVTMVTSDTKTDIDHIEKSLCGIGVTPFVSKYLHVPNKPLPGVFDLQAQFQKDANPQKCNLAIGVATNEDGSLFAFDAVRTVEADVSEETQEGLLTHAYPPMGGLPDLARGAAELVLGDKHTFIKDQKVQGVQALSGTGALRLVGEFLAHHGSPSSTVYLSNPTWGNHYAIFKNSGFSTIKEYRYYDNNTRSLDFDGLMEDLEMADEGDVIVLHACAHNPTGTDPTLEQWTLIADLCKRKALVPVFDCAYLGFATGDLDQDAQAMRHFANAGLEFFVCMSFSKNFGIYGQRCGATLFISEDSETVSRVNSQLKGLSRALWSVPPIHGARIVTRILADPSLRAQWKKELRELAERIQDTRQCLYTELHANTQHLPAPGCWEHIVTQRGMFSFSGLRKSQVKYLKEEHSVYMLPNGRINICGIPSARVQYIASLLAEAYARED
eukprot:gene1120-7930_t